MSKRALAIALPSLKKKNSRKITITNVRTASKAPSTSWPLAVAMTFEALVRKPDASFWKSSGDIPRRVWTRSRRPATWGSATKSE